MPVLSGDTVRLQIFVDIELKERNNTLKPGAYGKCHPFKFQCLGFKECNEI